MCECKLKENFESVESEMIAISNKIDKLNKKIELQELIIALREREIQELNEYIDPSECCPHCGEDHDE